MDNDKSPKNRIEHDALGSIEVDAESYAGSFYSRARNNFKISEMRAPKSFRIALAWIKISAAKTNAKLGKLKKEWAESMEQAGREFINGKFDEFFDLDVYQAGAGTPYNMNLNEIIANRANEILGGKKGEYKPIHPNDHVNMSQSSNDVIPSAIRIAAMIDLQDLLKAGKTLINSFKNKSDEFAGIEKVGRTHLQDAVPVTMGQEFGAYASAIEQAIARIEGAGKDLEELGIGGTATGSGINVDTKYAGEMCKELTKLSGFKFRPTDNKFRTTHSMAVFLALSGALRGLAVEILRISNDLRLMNSGPFAGLNEIELPEVQPGSSIMPGKVNPSIVECMSMICVQVMGLDHAIDIASQQGEFELNWYTPLIMFDLLHQIEILTSGMLMFERLCIRDIKSNEEHMREVLKHSTAKATALTPYMGYHKVAKLVNEAVRKGVPFESLVPKEFKKYLKSS